MTTYRNVSGSKEVEAELLAYPAKVEVRVVRRSLPVGGRIVRDAMRVEAPAKSGRLRKTIRVKTTLKKGRVTSRVTVGDRKVGVFYAHMVLGGTKAHVIRVRDGTKSLRIGGVTANFVMRKSVQHPGAKANNFTDRAKASIPRATDAIFSEARRLTDKLNAELMGPFKP